MAKRKHRVRKRTLRSAATLLVLLLTAAALRVGASTAEIAVQQESAGAVSESSEAIGVIVPPPGESEFPVLSAAGSYTGQAAVDINRGIPTLRRRSGNSAGCGPKRAMSPMRRSMPSDVATVGLRF